jgi:hypothetical protein
MTALSFELSSGSVQGIASHRCIGSSDAQWAWEAGLPFTRRSEHLAGCFANDRNGGKAGPRTLALSVHTITINVVEQ